MADCRSFDGLHVCYICRKFSHFLHPQSIEAMGSGLHRLRYTTTSSPYAPLGV
jgi:hypothetical protein